MKYDEHIIGEAVRIEVSEIDGKIYIVFEITDELYKKNIKQDWLKNIEFRIVNKSLVKND